MMGLYVDTDMTDEEKSAKVMGEIEWMKKIADDQIKLGPEKGSIKLIYFSVNFLLEAFPDPAGLILMLKENCIFFKAYYGNEDNIHSIVTNYIQGTLICKGEIATGTLSLWPTQE